MTCYLLDTNIVSHLMRRHPNVSRRTNIEAPHSLCISAITEGELRYGSVLRPHIKPLTLLVEEVLIRVDILPWDSTVAAHYAKFRVQMEREGKRLSPIDLLIAAHAGAVGATLVTNDKAFRHVSGLIIEDWTLP